MITICYRGRLGNNLIQYAAAYVLAKKTALKLDAPGTIRYGNTHTYKTSSRENNVIKTDLKSVFNIKPLVGDSFDSFIKLTDKNYFTHLETPVPNKAYQLDGFFQHKKLLVDCRREILNLYKLPESDFTPSKDSAFIACRLGDCLASSRLYCSLDGIECQLKTKRDLYDKVYITSDTINHPPLIELIKQYSLTVYQDEPIKTMLFAAKFNNLILSAGSFSYWMAYFSEATNIMVYRTRQCPLQRQKAWNYNKNVKFTT